MIDALFNQPNYQATRKLLDATVLRHEALASNLANLETPGYKRMDVAPVFETELQKEAYDATFQGIDIPALEKAWIEAIKKWK